MVKVACWKLQAVGEYVTHDIFIDHRSCWHTWTVRRRLVVKLVFFGLCMCVNRSCVSPDRALRLESLWLNIVSSVLRWYVRAEHVCYEHGGISATQWLSPHWSCRSRRRQEDAGEQCAKHHHYVHCRRWPSVSNKRTSDDWRLQFAYCQRGFLFTLIFLCLINSPILIAVF